MTTQPAPTIGGIIQRARLALGLTQREVADAMGVQRAHVGHWEQDKYAPTGDNVFRLAKLLGIPPQDITKAKAGAAKAAPSLIDPSEVVIPVRFNFPASDALVVRVPAENCAPFAEGDVVIIDTRPVSHGTAGVHYVRLGQSRAFRHIRTVKGHPVVTRPDGVREPVGEDFEIIGRVCWRGGSFDGA